MQKLSDTTVRFGSVNVPDVLRKSNVIGDWKQHIVVPFGAPFALPGTGTAPKGVPHDISVILTPRCDVPIVPVVESVTPIDFRFALRNADPTREADGISVDWLAVFDVAEAAPPPLDVRLSVLQHKAFSGFLDHQPKWPRIWFSTEMTAAPAVLLTANNLNVASDRNPAVVGHAGDLVSADDLARKGIIAPPAARYGMSVRAYDLDSVGGDTGFYAAAFATGANAPPVAASPLFVDSGTEKNWDELSLNADPVFEPPFDISPGGERGDWLSLDIYFNSPFLTPPIVLGTARGHTPVVTIARNVTTHGFTMAVRNTDSVGGHAGFHWVAIGCGPGCG
jgi:hypothetical protein